MRRFFALLAVGLVVALQGCAKGPDLDDATRRASDGLTTSAVFTVSTPSTVTPITPVLDSANGIFLGGNAVVVSGETVAMGSAGIDAEPGAILNETWSRGTATLKDRVNVRGTLHAAAVSLGNGVTIGSRDSTPHFDPPQTLSWNVTYPHGTGANVTVQAGQTQTLQPGLYGSVVLNSQSVLNLSTGTYYLTDFVVNAQVTVNLAQTNGPVIVYVANTLNLRGAFVPAGGTANGTIHPNLLIGYLGTNQVFVESLFDGAIVAPFATLTLRQVTGIHTGFFAAQTINNLDANTRVQYRAPLALVAAASPPGPQCLSLLSGLVPNDQLFQYCHKCLSPDDTDLDGVPDCADLCPYDPHKTAPGACGCNSADTDTDGDGVADCLDKCPNDPNNVYPGQCGCAGQPGLAPSGTPCTDTACPQTGAVCNGAGVCGNRAVCAPSPGPCTQVNSNGTFYWICGDPLPTAVRPDGGRENVSDGGAGAPGQGTESQALAACSAKGLTLTRIGSIDQNRLIASLISQPLWLGANDLSQSGVWRWSTPGSSNGDQFWSGGPTGTPANSLYSNWAPTSPGSNQCAAIRPGDGHWIDTPCSDALGYVCEYQTPAMNVGPAAQGKNQPAGAPAQPPAVTGACVSETNEALGGLPATLQQLSDELDAARQDHFVGAASPPPAPGSTCPSDLAPPSQGLGTTPDSGAGCWYTNPRKIPWDGGTAPDGGVIETDCFNDGDCTTAFGSGWTCRQLPNDPTCQPADAGPGAPTSLDQGGHCPGQAWCVQLQCTTTPGSCSEVQVCNPDASFDASPDPTTNLDAGKYNPAAMFGGTLPDASSVGFYSDPVDGATGPAHPWCWMVPQNPVPTANQPDQNTNGSSGHGSPISFGFDPNLEFTANANPLALGETNLGVHAGASFKATVNLNNFLGQTYSADIVDIGAGIDAERCSINNDRTELTILGLDILSLLNVGVPKFNSSDLFPDATRECNSAVSEFSLWANRAKKAYRDAQILLTQFKHANGAGMRLADDLCESIMSSISASDIPNFPGGLNCPTNEPAAVTINRFVDYLQAPGLGQITQLRHAAFDLVNKGQAIIDGVLPKINTKLLDLKQSESQTVLDVPFAIGPVPMVLQVDVFAGYGIAGNFDMAFTVPLAKLSGLDDTGSVANPNDGTTGQQIPVAHANLEVMPYAFAGLSAFVGAGVDLGAFSATLGIEGSVTLGQVSVPIFAGAGVELMEQYDPRPIPTEFASVSLGDNSSFNPVGSLFQFQLPKAAKFFVYYDYGAGIQLDNVLSGEIDVRLHISFFFFSKTWRKELVSFKGWSKHYDLISGSFGPNASVQPARAIASTATGEQQTTTEVGGTPPMGLAEQQFPLTVLMHLPANSQPFVDAGADGGDGGDAGDAGDGAIATVPVPTVEFDASDIQGFFYDDLCCVKANATCSTSGTPHCCPDFTCVSPDDSGTGTCVVQCIADGGACRPGSPAGCCAGTSCNANGVCAPPVPCIPAGQSCNGNLSAVCCTTGTSCNDFDTCPEEQPR